MNFNVSKHIAAPIGPAFSFHGIHKTYQSKDGGEIVALKDINYRAEAGQLVAVVGPSGCGKSTLLRILAGIESATEGQVQIAGRESKGPTRQTGIVFQSAVLLPWRTVLENVLLPSEIQKRDLVAARQQAFEYLDLVDLKGFESKYPNELSGGMQQRVGIARALVHSPTLLLMDEPFGALDAMTRETMNLELLRIREQTGAAIMLVTHSVPEAVFLGDRVVVMSPRPGRITKTIEIDLPRQRELKMINSTPFGDYVSDIREHLNATGGID